MGLSQDRRVLVIYQDLVEDNIHRLLTVSQTSRFFFWLCLSCSWILVSLGQPAVIPFLGLLSSAFGIALFWRALFAIQTKAGRFGLSVLWFASVQAVQLSWMGSIQYMGWMFLFVYAGLALGIGLQFGFLSLLFNPAKLLSFRSSLSIAGAWVLFEWLRLFVLTGFTFNPVGIALSGSVFSIQWAAIGGIYFLSFWVMLVNLLALNAFFLKRQMKTLILWASLALLPYLFGAAHRFAIERWVFSKNRKEIKAILVQTALLPEQRNYFRLAPDRYIPPLEQWIRIWKILPLDAGADLIVFPETAFPYGASRPLISFERAKLAWIRQFGADSAAALPPLAPPYAFFITDRGLKEWRVTHLYFAQALANYLKSRVIVGLDDADESGQYNAAFHFRPHSPVERYEKRVLMPVAEYLPFANIDLLSLFYAKQYHIFDSCTPGQEAKIFETSPSIGTSICYEETYTHIARESRLKGAELLVNISNDVWFPNTRLPEQHFHHGRIRAVENGIYLLRSCNTGVTGGVDCFGKPLATLPVSESQEGALLLTFPISSYRTLYTFWGDRAVLSISGLSLIWLPIFSYRRKGCSEMLT